MIKITIPYHLRNLAKVEGDLEIEVGETATIGPVMIGSPASFVSAASATSCQNSRFILGGSPASGRTW